MSGLTKEILAELGVLGVSVPRCIIIPSVSTYPETDLLNVQMNVMDMLVDDHEIAKLVSNCWCLGVDIKAFNVQKQCWDLLDLENDLELPHRASLQVIITDTQLGQPDTQPEPRTARRRDPRREEGRPQHQQGLLSRRDPRRKLREEIELETKEELPRLAASIPTPSEPDPSKLSRNDPRRRKLLEKTQTGSVRILPELPSTPASSLASLRPPPAPSKVHDDSDSDEGNLQIDESFDEKNSRKTSINKNMITESQLFVEEIEKIDYTEDVGDKALWDEIYGISGSSDSPFKIFDPQLDKNAKNSSGQDDVIFEKEHNPKGLLGEKTMEQLAREKELLMSLVAERDKMNNLVSSSGSSKAPEEIILEDEVEDGEISDSSSECEEAKDKDSDVEIMTPASPAEPSTGKPDFVSPASPTAIQLDLENDEIDIIPLEREDKAGGKSTGKSHSEVKIVSSSAPAEKYKKYWDQFPVEDEQKEKSESDQFSAARAKLSKYKNFIQNRDNRGRSSDPPQATELKPVVDERARPRPSRDQSFRTHNHVPPKELFLKAAQRSGISPFSSNNPTMATSSNTFTDKRDHQAGPRFSPPNQRKGVALLDKPKFPPPVKVVDYPQVNSSRSSTASHMFSSSSQVRPRPQPSSSFSFPPPPPPQIFQTAPVSQPVSYQANNQRMEFNTRTDAAAGNVWMTGWRQRESQTCDNMRSEDLQHNSSWDGRRRNRSGDQTRGQDRIQDWDQDWRRRRSKSRSPIRSESGPSAWRHGRSRSGEKSSPETAGAPTSRETVKAMKDSENAFLCFYEGEDCIEEHEVEPAPGEPGPAVPANLNNKHPVSAVYEYKGRMNYPPPKFKEVWGPGGTWAFDVTLGPHTFSCPRFRTKKKDAKAEACRYALQMLGAWN